MRLANKVAIVTGGGTGTGAAIARLFAKEGAAVYFASDESPWTTGSVLTVDGGVMAQ